MPGPVKLSAPATKEFWEIPVLHEDEHLLALDKPARLLVSPDRYDPERPNLMRLLHSAIAAGKPWAKERDLTYLSNAHRLDFETTGVLLLAKDKPTLVSLANLFGSNKPLKEYLALVHGRPEQPEFEIDAPLSPHPMQPGVMRVDPKNGKKSHTRFELVEAFDGYSLLRCRPVTGRTHQIRVHLKWAKLPICCDETYQGKPLWLSRLKRNFRLKGDKEERPLTPRLALHASKLTLPHPATGENVVIDAPLPRDLSVALKYLRKFAAGGAPPPDSEPLD